MILVYVALLVAAIGWGLQIAGYARRKSEEREQAIAECAARGHYWRYQSAYDEGQHWTKSCPQCPIGAVYLTIEQVPDDELEACRRRREERNRKRKLVGR